MAEEESISILYELKALRKVTEEMRDEQMSKGKREVNEKETEIEKRIESLTVALESVQRDVGEVKEAISSGSPTEAMDTLKEMEPDDIVCPEDDDLNGYSSSFPRWHC